MICIYNVYSFLIFREIDNMVKLNNHQSETIKSLENEMKKCNKRKQELEADVSIIIENFEVAKNSLTKIVCIVYFVTYVIIYNFNQFI